VPTAKRTRHRGPYLMKLMADAKLDISVDAAGNIFGKRAGTDASLNRFSLARIRIPFPRAATSTATWLAWRDRSRAVPLRTKITTRHPLEVVIWQNEEGGPLGQSSRLGCSHCG